jgi:hypothetical protein
MWDECLKLSDMTKLSTVSVLNLLFSSIFSLSETFNRIVDL